VLHDSSSWAHDTGAGQKPPWAYRAEPARSAEWNVNIHGGQLRSQVKLPLPDTGPAKPPPSARSDVKLPLPDTRPPPEGHQEQLAKYQQGMPLPHAPGPRAPLADPVKARHSGWNVAPFPPRLAGAQDHAQGQAEAADGPVPGSRRRLQGPAARLRDCALQQARRQGPEQVGAAELAPVGVGEGRAQGSQGGHNGCVRGYDKTVQGAFFSLPQ